MVTNSSPLITTRGLYSCYLQDPYNKSRPCKSDIHVNKKKYIYIYIKTMQEGDDLAVKGTVELLFRLFHVPSKNFTTRLSCLVTSALDLKHNSIQLSKFNL